MSETRCTCDPHPTWPHEPDCPRAQPTPPAEGEMKTVARLAAIAAQVQAAPAEGERRLPLTVSIVRREQGGVQIEGHTLAQDWEIEVDEHGTLLSMSLEAVPSTLRVSEGETAREPIVCIACGAKDAGGCEVEDGPGPFCLDCWDRIEAAFSNRAEGETAEGLSAEQQIARLTAERDRLRAALRRFSGAFKGMADALDAQAAEIARLNTIIEITNRHIERLLPCPDCRDKVRAGECERCKRQKAEAMLAACYRLTGADPDGNEDAALAAHAVAEVRRMRAEAEKAEAEIATLRAKLAEAEQKPYVQVAPLAQTVTCGYCKGIGKIEHRTPVARGTLGEYWSSEMRPCEFCGGAGRVWVSWEGENPKP